MNILTMDCVCILPIFPLYTFYNGGVIHRTERVAGGGLGTVSFWVISNDGWEGLSKMVVCVVQ